MIDLIKEYIKFKKDRFVVNEQDNFDNLLKHHNAINSQIIYNTINEVLLKTYVDENCEHEKELKWQWQNLIDSINPILSVRKK